MSDESTNPFNTAAPSSDPFAAAKASAVKAAEDLRAAASAKAQEFRSVAEQKVQGFRSTAEGKAHEFRDYAGQAWTDASSQAKDYAAEAERFAREKPIQALLTAFGVGFLVGVFLKK